MHSRPASKRASIATPPTSASVPTANTTSAAELPMPPRPFRPQSGKHNIAIGDPLPDTLSGFLSGSPLPTPSPSRLASFPAAQHIGPAAINRNNVNAYGAGHLEGDAALHAGLRRALGALHAHHRARPPHRRLPAPSTACRSMSSIRSPATGPTGMASGRACRPRGRLRSKLAGARRRRHHGDSAEYLAGQLPHRLHALCDLSAPASPPAVRPFQYGFQITPAQLPTAYTPAGVDIFASRQHQGRGAQHRHGCGPL